MAGNGKRRTPGEGTIYYDEAHNRWHAQVTLDDGKRKSLYGKTAAEVREKQTALNRDRDRGMVIPEGQMTVKQYLTDWLDQVRPTVKESAWMSYETRVRVHLIPGLGKHKLAKLSAHQVQAFYAAKLKTDISPTTVRRMHEVLHHALHDALRLDLVTRNVTELVDAPREAQTETRVYTIEQVATLLDALQGERLEALILLAMTTGMREGELLALRWRDVDLTCGTLQVRASRSVTRKGYVDDAPKTKASAAKVVLTATAVEALKRQRVRVKEERLRVGERWKDSGDLVFPSSVGTHITPPNLRKQWINITRAAGLPYIRFHDLRHTNGTLLTESGVDLRWVSAALRHARLATTQRYTHVTATMQERTVDAMERIMEQARGTQTGQADGTIGAPSSLPNKD